MVGAAEGDVGVGLTVEDDPVRIGEDPLIPIAATIDHGDRFALADRLPVELHIAGRHAAQ